MSKLIENTFLCPNGVTLGTYMWTCPDAVPVEGLAFFLHGLFDHCGRYDEMARHFAAHGLEVHAVDMAGHGKSTGDRGVIGDFEQLVTDVHEFIVATLLQEVNLKRKYVIVGKALGSIVATAVVQCAMSDAVRKPSAFLMISPAGKIRQSFKLYSLRKAVARVAKTVAPKMSLATFNVSGMNRCPVEMQRYLDDPLVHHGSITSLTASTMLKAIDKQSFSAIACPVLIQAAEHETVVDRDAALTMFECVPAALKVLKTYSESWHDLIHEPEPTRRQVIDDLVDFARASLNLTATTHADILPARVTRTVDMLVPGGLLTADSSEELTTKVKLLAPLLSRLNSEWPTTVRYIGPGCFACAFCAKRYATSALVETHVGLRHDGEALPLSPPTSPPMSPRDDSAPSSRQPSARDPTPPPTPPPEPVEDDDDEAPPPAPDELEILYESLPPLPEVKL
jgi:alpha-beta hydrolase superfamily lysophospholipase